MFAPWEGRPDPSPAEIDFLTLIGQHAATALDHTLLYARVRAQADELHRLAGIQADFLRGVTHDLQTPLTRIGALASELRANEELPDAERGDLDSIAYQADRLRRMVGQLLVASRLEANAFSSQIDIFNVVPVIERTWAALRASRPFELVVNGPPHLAVADQDRLEQVLWAIFDNAIKYSPDGSKITAAVAAAERSIAITVTDHGIGMDPVTREHAFQQFFRAPGARKLAPDGSGVGLYAARGLVEAMGGEIRIQTRLGGGTSISIQIPAEPSGGSAE
jgi:signal transduction histidine kinase